MDAAIGNPLFQKIKRWYRRVTEKKLLIMYQTGPQINVSDILDLVSENYALQRKEINHVKFKIEEFKNRWPCVFLKSGLMIHFFNLVDINLESRLEEERKKRLSNYEFFESSSFGK